MKRKILLLAAVVMCVSIIASGTLAYFTSEDEVHNVITTDAVDIQIEEWQETAEGLTLESTLGTDGEEDKLVERLALRQAIDTLPEKERMTILLRFFKCLTQQQTARILGVSQVQVSRLERRSLAKLRLYLEE